MSQMEILYTLSMSDCSFVNTHQFRNSFNFFFQPNDLFYDIVLLLSIQIDYLVFQILFMSRIVAATNRTRTRENTITTLIINKNNNNKPVTNSKQHKTTNTEKVMSSYDVLIITWWRKGVAECVILNHFFETNGFERTDSRVSLPIATIFHDKRSNQMELNDVRKRYTYVVYIPFVPRLQRCAWGHRPWSFSLQQPCLYFSGPCTVSNWISAGSRDSQQPSQYREAIAALSDHQYSVFLKQSSFSAKFTGCYVQYWWDQNKDDKKCYMMLMSLVLWLAGIIDNFVLRWKRLTQLSS